VGVSKGGLRREEWGERFCEVVLLPCSANLREGFAGYLDDEFGCASGSGKPHNWGLS